MKFFVVLFLVLQFCVFSGLVQADVSFNGVLPEIKGRIVHNDVIALESALSKSDPFALKLVGVTVNSPGGDIYSAMEMGRLIRKARAPVHVIDQCSSACVFILMGGVERYILGEVAIHRPYSTFVGSKDYDSFQKNYSELKDDIRSYFEEMNFSKSLLDTMLKVPSDESYVLTYDEKESFGLFGLDPVEAELRNSSKASYYKLSKTEFFERNNRAKIQCKLPFGYPSDEDIKHQIDCETAIMYGMTLKDYWIKEAMGKEACSKYSNDRQKYLPCITSYIRGEKYE